MKATFTHYTGRDTFDSMEWVDEFNEPTSQPTWNKPQGFWMSIPEGENSWHEFVSLLKLRNKSLEHRHDFTVDMSNVLLLDNKFDLWDFTKIYGSRGGYDIDWSRVAQDMDGVHVPNPVAFQAEFAWLERWDVHSVVVWKSDTLKNRVKVA